MLRSNTAKKALIYRPRKISVKQKSQVAVVVVTEAAVL